MTVGRNACYVDTSAFIAFLDKSDRFRPLFRNLFLERPPLLTSALVIAEGHGWFLRKYNTRQAARFLAFVRELPRLSIQSFDSAALSHASAVAGKFVDQKLTLADARGIAIMKEHALKSCWSTDRHLGLTGVPLVIQNMS
jgi:predicted nucleic acid-binding protein